MQLNDLVPCPRLTANQVLFTFHGRAMVANASRAHCQPHCSPEISSMKKLAIVASLVLFAACAPKAEEAPAAAAADTTAAAAATTDTMMKADSTAAAPAADTTKH